MCNVMYAYGPGQWKTYKSLYQAMFIEYKLQADI